MALVLADRVRETTTTTGTGSVTLAGAYTGFQTFSAGIGNANNTYYTIANSVSGEWEVGIGTYTTSGNTLSRTTVLSSSNAGSLVNFGAGSKDVFVTQPAERAVYVNAANTQVSVPQLVATSITNSGLTSGRVVYSTTGGLETDSANLTFDGTTLSTAGLSDSGNLTFTGTGNRITGDFSNATIANRVAFQSSTTNGNTQVGSIPNGTSTTAQFVSYNNSDPTNASTLTLTSFNTEARIASGITGTGTYLPMTFYTGGSEAVRIGSGASSATDKGTVGIGYTSLTGVGNNGLAVLGNVGIGTSSPAYKLDVSGAISTNNNLTFTGTGNRITGDMTNATIANRVAFQTSTANSTTTLEVIPSGTGFASQLVLETDQGLVNTSYLGLLSSTGLAESRITSGNRGTGTYLPMTFYTSGTEKLRIAADTTGTYTFGGTAPRITGDFSNATQTNRVSFQSSTTNGNTSIAAIPNGTATGTNWVAFSTADPTNSSFIRIRVDGTAALTYLESGASGSGTNLPLIFNTAGGEKMRIDTVGNAQFQAGAVMPYAPAPASISAATTLTNANIQGQIISATGTTYTITMPLGTTLETLATWATTNIGYDFFVINTASGIITMAVNTGVTSLGSLTVAATASAHFRIRRTAANTFVLYRLV